jgi:hypothetical protein
MLLVIKEKKYKPGLSLNVGIEEIVEHYLNPSLRRKRKPHYSYLDTNEVFYQRMEVYEGGKLVMEYNGDKLTFYDKKFEQEFMKVLERKKMGVTK